MGLFLKKMCQKCVLAFYSNMKSIHIHTNEFNFTCGEAQIDKVGTLKKKESQIIPRPEGFSRWDIRTTFVYISVRRQ